MMVDAAERRALRRAREIRKDPKRDAHGRQVMRGDALHPIPVSERWDLWKRCGFLARLIPKVPGWLAWREQEAPCDRTTRSPLPG